MAIVYLGLGANLGDRRAALRLALGRLAPPVRVTAASSLYETEPVGYRQQPDFLNAVVQAETNLAPRPLLELMQRVERGLGRQARFRNAPREIDLDILFYDEITVDEEGLIIPHPRLTERAFVLVPLVELAPTLWHPWLGRSVAELLDVLDPTDQIRQIEGASWADGLPLATS